MANTSTYVSAGKPNVEGAIYVGPLTATLPTAADTTLTGFTPLGYISEDGLVNTNTIEMEHIKAWGGDIVLSTQTDREDSFKFTLIEALNPNVLKEIYGTANVTGALATGVEVTATGDEHEARAWIFDMILNGGVLKRIVVPIARITEIGDINYQDGEPIGYEVTITANPDEDGATHYEYLKSPSTSGSTL